MQQPTDAKRNVRDLANLKQSFTPFAAPKKIIRLVNFIAAAVGGGGYAFVFISYT